MMRLGGLGILHDSARLAALPVNRGRDFWRRLRIIADNPALFILMGEPSGVSGMSRRFV